MTDYIERDTVTDNTGILRLDSGLELEEITDRWLWSLQPGRQDSLNAFSKTVFGAGPRPREVLRMDCMRLLSLWPHKAYLLSSASQLPQVVDEFAGIMTEISHGFCEFRLGGEKALELLGSYCSLDPSQQRTSEMRSLRCLLGQYPVLLWWDDIDDIRMLVERSLAQSFHEYLASLMVRWSSQHSC
jgi:sarcosine oxidase gamma subunit